MTAPQPTAESRPVPRTIVTASAVTKSFGSNRAVAGVDLTLAGGEVVGFVGPNGAGKTTFLRILTGLVFRDGGDVDVLGLDPAADPVAVRRRCCYLPGETSVYHGMTGSQFLEFAWAYYPARRDAADALIEAFPLPLDQRVRDYSAGMKQKLALIATLAPDVEIYLLDEPDRALDANARLLLRDALGTLRAEGRTVMLSSHHLSEIEAIADRTVFLLDGSIVPTSEIDEARRGLRRELRIRTTPDYELPTESIEHREVLPDGTQRITPRGEPIEWLASLPAASVVTAEIGATRLEDLYRVLIGTRATANRSSEVAS